MALAVTNILISDLVDPICASILEQHGFQVTCQQMSKDQLLKEIQNYEALIVRSETKVTPEVLLAARRMKVIGRAGTGVDNVDLAAATRNGVLVMNTPGGNTLSAAEHTCAMIACLSRHIPQACGALKRGRWDRKKYLGNELHGKTLAILGLGRIGKEVAFRMQAFGMKTIGFDPITTVDQALEVGIEKLELADIWPRADYITIHTPLIPQTKNLINTETLQKCRPTVRIVNVARGGIIDEEALLAALNAGKCGGAALDVFVQEPPKEDSVSMRLCEHPLVVATPHLGASTQEAQERVAKEIAEQLIDLVQGRQAVGVVNSPSVGLSLLSANKPWIQLSQALGHLAARLINSATAVPCTSDIVTLTSYGEGVEDVALLANAALVGTMAGMTPNGVNMVNAALLATEKGWTVNSAHVRDTKGLNGLARGVHLSISRQGLAVDLIGTVQGDSPVLYSINGSRLEHGATLSGNVLIFSFNQKGTSLLGLLGLLAGKVPVSTVMLTRESEHQAPFLLLRTAEAVPDPQLLLAAHVNQVPDIVFVAQLNF